MSIKHLFLSSVGDSASMIGGVILFLLLIGFEDSIPNAKISLLMIFFAFIPISMFARWNSEKNIHEFKIKNDK